MSIFAPLVNLPVALPNVAGMNHSREYITSGNRGTGQTITRMRDLVSHGKRDFRIRKLAGQIIRNCSPKDYSCYAQAVFHYCRDRIKYAFDPNGVELVESPWNVVESGIADCDSIVVLCASLLENLGLPCRFVTIKADVSKPDQYSHVYLECLVPKLGWVAMDCTMHDKPFGWKPEAHWPRKTWPASWDGSEQRDGDKMAGLSGLNDLPEWDADLVPGVGDTVGVRVGNLWEWQQERALETATEGQLEMQPYGPIGPIDPAVFTPDMFTRQQASAVIAEKQAPVVSIDAVQVRAKESAGPKLLKWGGIALLAYAVWRAMR